MTSLRMYHMVIVLWRRLTCINLLFWHWYFPTKCLLRSVWSWPFSTVVFIYKVAAQLQKFSCYFQSSCYVITWMIHYRDLLWINQTIFTNMVFKSTLIKYYFHHYNIILLLSICFHEIFLMKIIKRTALYLKFITKLFSFFLNIGIIIWVFIVKFWADSVYCMLVNTISLNTFSWNHILPKRFTILFWNINESTANQI